MSLPQGAKKRFQVQTALVATATMSLVWAILYWGFPRGRTVTRTFNVRPHREM